MKKFTYKDRTLIVDKKGHLHIYVNGHDMNAGSYSVWLVDELLKYSDRAVSIPKHDVLDAGEFYHESVNVDGMVTSLIRRFRNESPLKWNGRYSAYRGYSNSLVGGKMVGWNTYDNTERPYALLPARGAVGLDYMIADPVVAAIDANCKIKEARVYNRNFFGANVVWYPSRGKKVVDDFGLNGGKWPVLCALQCAHEYGWTWLRSAPFSEESDFRMSGLTVNPYAIVYCKINCKEHAIVAATLATWGFVVVDTERAILGQDSAMLYGIGSFMAADGGPAVYQGSDLILTFGSRFQNQVIPTSGATPIVPMPKNGIMVGTPIRVSSRGLGKLSLAEAKKEFDYIHSVGCNIPCMYSRELSGDLTDEEYEAGRKFAQFAAKAILEASALDPGLSPDKYDPDLFLSLYHKADIDNSLDFSGVKFAFASEGRLHFGQTPQKTLLWDEEVK